MAPLEDGKQTGKQLKGRIVELVEQMRSNRDPKAQNAPDLKNFKQILEHWEISEDEIKPVMKGFRIQVILFSVMGIIGLVQLVKGIANSHILQMVNGSVLVTLAVVIGLTRAWRISVLKNKKFKYFKDWLLNLMDFSKGGNAL